MSSKKKQKPTKLTEEDYNNYIMSLKDENPIGERISKTGTKPNP